MKRSIVATLGPVKLSCMLCVVIAIGFLPIDRVRADDDTQAQETEQLGAITVTAQKRTQDAQEIPDSITVLDDLTIEDAGIFDLERLSDMVPNLEFYNFGSRRHSLTFMRGIKNIHSGEPATGYYVDGVNYGKSYMFDFPLFDIERIEVLRGPQGTLYGRNTMAGVINVYTKMPGNETAAGLGGVLGNYDQREIKGYLRTPVIKDKLFLGIAGQGSSRDGYMENDVPGVGDDGRHMEGRSGRAIVKYYPADRWDITLGLDGQQHDDGAFTMRRTERNSFVKAGKLSADEPYHYSHDYAGTAENTFWGSSLNISGDLPWGRLTAISGYRDYDSDETIDLDFSPMDMARMNYVLEERSFSQEIRFASPEDGKKLTWLGGLYYFHIDNEKKATTEYRPAMAGSPSNPFSPNTGARMQDTDGLNQGAAVFGQFIYPIVEKLDLTLGLRYEVEEAEMDAAIHDTPDGGSTTITNQPALENDFSALLPKASLAWHFASEKMLYATVAEGHRSGGFNAFGSKDSYDEEYSWLYEIGAKSRFWDNRLEMNLSGFYMDIRDEQVTLFDGETNQSYVNNAGASHRVGAEAEASCVLFSGLMLSASFSLLEAEYDEYEDPVTETDYEGNTVFGVPDYTFNLAAQYRRGLWKQWHFFGRMEFNGMGNRYFDDANTVKGSPYELVNLKIGVEGDHLEGYLWSKNLLDREYVLFENTVKGIAEDGEPLTFGVTVNYRF